jgi:hypothetical protein
VITVVAPSHTTQAHGINAPINWSKLMIIKMHFRPTCCSAGFKWWSIYCGCSFSRECGTDH